MKSKKLSNRQNFRRTKYGKKNKNVYNLSKKRRRQFGGADIPTPQKSEVDVFYNDRFEMLPKFEMLQKLNSEMDASTTNSAGEKSYNTPLRQYNAQYKVLITKVNSILESVKINNIFKSSFQEDYTKLQSGGMRRFWQWKAKAKVNTTVAAPKVAAPKVDTKLRKVLTFIVAFDNYISNSNVGNKDEIETFLRLHSITETGSVFTSPLFKNILFLISKRSKKDYLHNNPFLISESSKKDYYLNRLLIIAGVSLLCTVEKFRTYYDSTKTPFNADVEEPFNADVEERKRDFLKRFLRDNKYRTDEYEDLLQTAVKELVEKETFDSSLKPSPEGSSSLPLSEYYYKLLYSGDKDSSYSNSGDKDSSYSTSGDEDDSYSNEKELYKLIHAHVAEAPKVTTTSPN
jgi:hypothetical protein